MIYVTLAVVAGWILSLGLALQLARAERRQHARERDLLLNQLLHAVGKPWVEAPAADRALPEREPRTWTATPEQQPIFD